MATFSFQFYPHGLTCTSAHAYRKWLQDDLPLGWWNIGRQPEEFTISQSAHSCTGVTRLIEMGKSTTRLRDVLLHFCQAVSLIHVHWCHAISLFSVLVFIMPLLFHWFYSTATDYCLHSGWSQRHESHDTWAPFKMIFGKGVFFFVFLDTHMVSLLHWLNKTPHDCWQKPLPNNRYLHPDPKIEGFSDGGSENSPQVLKPESHQRAQCGIPSTFHEEREERAHPRCAVNGRVAHVTAAARAVSQRPRNGFCRMPRTANRREQEGAQTTAKLVYNIL